MKDQVKLVTNYILPFIFGAGLMWIIQQNHIKDLHQEMEFQKYKHAQQEMYQKINQIEEDLYRRLADVNRKLGKMELRNRMITGDGHD